jgi:WS/DGAT/MGAT family acyltransferase
VHRLSGLEVNFLNRESETQNANMGYLVTLRSDDGPDIELSDLRERIAARLDLVPSLRWRLRRVPLGLHHPVLVDDPDFDLDRHLRAVTLPDGDDGEALNRLVAETTRRPLDRERSLWNLTLVSGIGAGRQALILVVHHVLGDGVALTTTVERLFNDDAPEVTEGAVPWTPERPTRARLLAHALLERAKLTGRVPRLLADTRRGLRAKRQRIALTAGDGSGAPMQRVPVSPSYALAEARVFSRSQLELSDFRLVRQAADISLNDVLMGVVGIAFRRYLVARHELPATPLVSGVMVSTEVGGATVRQSGNSIANFVTTLATQIEDPWEQLLAIAGAAGEARHRLELVGLDIPTRWLDMVPPALAVPLARRDRAKRRKDPSNVRASTVVSNMRGAPPFCCLGWMVDGTFPIGQVLDTIGVFVVANSSGERFNLNVLANPTALECPDDLVGLFGQVLGELVRLAQSRSVDRA